MGHPKYGHTFMHEPPALNQVGVDLTSHPSHGREGWGTRAFVVGRHSEGWHLGPGQIDFWIGGCGSGSCLTKSTKSYQEDLLVDPCWAHFCASKEGLGQ
jgi:hypothetical protein